MTGSARRGATWLFALLLASSGAVAASPLAREPAQDRDTPLLDVPYLPQPEALCGGAAVSMVMRYWGDRDVYPSDFSGLVDPEAAGIHANELSAAVNARGWSAYATSGDADGAGLRRQLDDGRPVVALIEDRPGVFHYVVVIGWRGDRVVLHDPARGPFRDVDASDFTRRWAAAGDWALTIVPRGEARPGGPLADTAANPSVEDAGACDSFVARGVALARAHDLDGASASLGEATVRCPADAAGWRELAAVRFLEKQWTAAARDAMRATRLSPDDEYAWRLLGSSRYLDGDGSGALTAWNRLGEPTIDVVRIEGLGRIRHPVVRGAVDLEPRATLTAATLERARHRLEALPAVASSRVDYRIGADGRAEVQVAVHERALGPTSPWALATIGGRAAIGRELRVDVGSPTGSGEMWSGAWRYWTARPRVALGLALPSPRGLPGITSIEASWERQTYAATGPIPMSRAAHRHVSARVSDWLTGPLRWEAGAAIDGWDETSHAGLDGALELRLAGDRVAVGARTAVWAPAGDDGGFGMLAARAAWRSTRPGGAARWTAVAGVIGVSPSAPLDLWPGAGAGHARDAFLRAHPLLDGGAIAGAVFGRRVAHASLAYDHPIYEGVVGVGVAAFGDVARAWARRDGTRSRWHVDTGVGLRLTAPGIGGTVRLDVARGLADGRVAVSAGWQPPWPWR